MPYFFFSYARADWDGYLAVFYRDLCEAVRARTGLRPDEIGFRDQSRLAVGVNWMNELATALRSARVFVAMCSPSYFTSDMCGREWQMYTELARFRQSGSGLPVSLLPIIWIPTGNMPGVALDLQHTHEELGEVYQREGLQFLRKLRRYRDDYQMFVTRFAERIVAAGGQGPPAAPAHPSRLEDVESAFPPGQSATERGDPAAGEKVRAEPSQRTTANWPMPSGPRHVHFVIVAAPSYKVGQLRGDTQFYGPSAYDWAPYKPQFPQRVCVFAQNVASTNDLTSALATAESSIVGLLDKAKERNELVVLIVDVWTTRLSPYDVVLMEYDERNEPTSAVMVPWNETDAEIRGRSEELREDLRRAFPNNTARGDDVFRPTIPTHERLQSALEEVLARLQSRVFQLGKVRRRAGGERAVARPILTHPDEGAVR